MFGSNIGKGIDGFIRFGIAAAVAFIFVVIGFVVSLFISMTAMHLFIIFIAGLGVGYFLEPDSKVYV